MRFLAQSVNIAAKILVQEVRFVDTYNSSTPKLHKLTAKLQRPQLKQMGLEAMWDTADGTLRSCT